MRVILPLGGFTLAVAAMGEVWLMFTAEGKRYRRRRLLRKADHASKKGRTRLAEEYERQAEEVVGK